MKIYKNHHMKEYSNMKIGGMAKELIIIEKKEEAVEVLKTRKKTFLIGNGTNTLIPDRDMDISFISLNKLNNIEDLGDGRIYVESGLNFDDLIDFTAEKNYSGLENLAGIPGSVGGLIYMNGGAYGSEVFDYIEEIEIIDENFEIRKIKKSEIYVTYRNTEIQEKKWVVISAVFKFEMGFDRERVLELKGKRESRHPLSMPNLGSTFKNPEGHFSAKLIIAAGVQGHKVGDMQVSNVHPNFLENHGSAKYNDVIEIIRTVKEKVKLDSGIELEEEIVIIED
ncbi:MULTISPECIES: UDP-N-acetylmuramate dehydrogenase [Psychrilyobacter]|uniref:UDP-N-acetylenolpyruvoylglucosamine reductase n=1 Tax=Psychrilyobacter piezotolerans TaxID=2293438 RepID=A0ABX9KF89_9FUSO|nr:MULTISPECIES: UDP-N-acetylmuramate dehydrogenase [Psychrilyobacter]MCS5421553.1 UDP-N-acetylmuramate dehydrogenase [Psychrilyobacter sp. S5]NDI78676.1 UDP-N-acetylmuramate dehydrogenase [Psychrilyobacter piezotolerans]RDE60027.1 UDP-N-acetylmuramate dehydrogenase [Psychrilyobacter sp. S5]REI40254.1 UDP-N-acetylmuramate dehydrogenase [Psychrilyobacter piezotolerans]